jgi:hypothetical protein
VVLIKLGELVLAGTGSEGRPSTCTADGKGNAGRWIAYISLLPPGVENWLENRNIMMFATAGSYRIHEIDASRAALTKAMEQMPIGEFIIIPFQIKRWVDRWVYEPTLAVMSKEKWTKKNVEDLLVKQLKPEHSWNDTLLVDFDGWRYQISSTHDQYVKTSPNMSFLKGKHYYISIEGINITTDIGKLLKIMFNIIEPRLVDNIYWHKSGSSMTVVICTEEEINANWINVSSLGQFNSGIDIDIMVYNTLPGFEDVGWYKHHKDKIDQVPHWTPFSRYPSYGEAYKKTEVDDSDADSTSSQDV